MRCHPHVHRLQGGALPMRRWPCSLQAPVQPSSRRGDRTIVIPRAGAGEKVAYQCRECGARHIQWFGRCRECSKPATLEKVAAHKAPAPGAGGARSAARILQVRHSPRPRPAARQPGTAPTPTPTPTPHPARIPPTATTTAPTAPAPAAAATAATAAAAGWRAAATTCQSWWLT
jgi:hypothetical protein